MLETLNPVTAATELRTLCQDLRDRLAPGGVLGPEHLRAFHGVEQRFEGCTAVLEIPPPMSVRTISRSDPEFTRNLHVWPGGMRLDRARRLVPAYDVEQREWVDLSDDDIEKRTELILVDDPFSLPAEVRSYVAVEYETTDGRRLHVPHDSVFSACRGTVDEWLRYIGTVLLPRARGMVVSARQVQQTLQDDRPTPARESPATPGDYQTARDLCSVSTVDGLDPKQKRWSFNFNGETASIKHRKWMPALVELLHKPDQPLHVTYLAKIVEPADVSHDETAVTDALPDEEALGQYESALETLNQERLAAEEAREIARAEDLDEQIRRLEGEISRARDRKGDHREKSDPHKRLRQNARKGLKACVSDLERHLPALAAHLEANLKYGTDVAYEPDPPVTWTT